MPDPVTGLVVGGSTLLSGVLQANAASDAANTQAGMAQAGIAEQRRQFDAIQKLMEPYVQAGTGALGAQQALVGLGGVDAQQSAISNIQNSPIFQGLVRQGENSILQNASATGGLRGGNTQAALAQFSPAMLQKSIDDRFAKLGGLTTLGQNSAAGVGNAGLSSANQVSSLLGEQGAAQAGGVLGQAKAYGNLLNLPAQFLGGQIATGSNIF